MSLVSCLFASTKTSTAVVRYPLEVVVNGTTTKPKPPTRLKVAEVISWKGSIAQSLVNQKNLPDVSGVVLFDPEEVSASDVPMGCRIDILADDIVTGTVNNGAGYSTGATAMSIDAMTGAVKNFDTFYVLGETGSPEHEVSSVTLTNGVPTAIKFTPALASNVLDNTVITFYPILSRVSAIYPDNILNQGDVLMVPVKDYV